MCCFSESAFESSGNKYSLRNREKLCCRNCSPFPFLGLPEDLYPGQTLFRKFPLWTLLTGTSRNYAQKDMITKDWSLTVCLTDASILRSYGPSFATILSLFSSNLSHIHLCLVPCKALPSVPVEYSLFEMKSEGWQSWLSPFLSLRWKPGVVGCSVCLGKSLNVSLSSHALQIEGSGIQDLGQLYRFTYCQKTIEIRKPKAIGYRLFHCPEI